jgi:anti-anti-sigma regulatory factor
LTDDEAFSLTLTIDNAYGNLAKRINLRRIPMRISARGNLIVETAARGVRVMRFARPDMRQYLDDAGDAATSPLFQEIQGAVLSDLPAGWTLVVNLGLIDPINAAFYRCLLAIRERVRARRGRLVLCGLSPRHQEIFDLFRGPRVFTIVSTEAEACRESPQVAGRPGERPKANGTRGRLKVDVRRGDVLRARPG